MGKVNCCYCIPIKAGVTAIAAIGLFGGICQVRIGTAVFAGDFGNATFIGKLLTDMLSANSFENHTTIIQSQAAYAILTGFTGTIMSIILLMCFKDNNTSNLPVWVRCSNIFLATLAALQLILAAVYEICLQERECSSFVIFGFLLFQTIGIFISAYYVEVVKHYAENVKEQTQPKGIQPNVALYKNVV